MNRNPSYWKVAVLLGLVVIAALLLLLRAPEKAPAPAEPTITYLPYDSNDEEPPEGAPIP